jgi:hypothetical protein
MGKSTRPFQATASTLLLALGAQAQESATAPPVLFTENQGQCPPEVRFQARTRGLVASVHADRLVLALDGAPLTLRFGGGAECVEGLQPSRARFHFVRGAQAVTDVPGFSAVRLVGLPSGLELELYEREGRLEYDWIASHGSDLRAAEITLEGAEAAWIDAEGALCAEVEGRTLRQLAPRAWLETPDGDREPVACAWRARGPFVFGFDLADVPGVGRLVIDPVLVYSATVGGSNADHAADVRVDAEGALVATGWARSGDFPAVSGGGGGEPRSRDVVVFKLAPDGRELLFAAYFGGRGEDQGEALALGPAGEVYVAGSTQSDDFPTTDQAFARRFGGASDGFLMKLDAEGHLLHSTFLGGSAEDEIRALELGQNGQLTVAGTTRSRDFPVSSQSYVSAAAGARDAFVARLDGQAERLLFGTRIGGSADDSAQALAVDAQGCSYVTGQTGSHDFPTTLGAYDRERCGLDAFVVKLSSGGRTLLYSTFLGGSLQDEAMGLAVDALGRAVVVGSTQSLDFPFQAGQTPAGRKDAFLVRLSATGNGLAQALAIGGGSADEALDVALDSFGVAWVVGQTRSTDFPVTRDAQRARLSGPADAFLVQYAAEGHQRLYATLLGLAGEDELVAAHVDTAGRNLALAGSTSEVLQHERGPLSGRRRGSSDAWLLRLDPRASAPVTPGPLQAGLGF